MAYRVRRWGHDRWEKIITGKNLKTNGLAQEGLAQAADSK
jgi:hypothetical protein